MVDRFSPSDRLSIKSFAKFQQFQCSNCTDIKTFQLAFAYRVLMSEVRPNEYGTDNTRRNVDKKLNLKQDNITVKFI